MPRVLSSEATLNAQLYHRAGKGGKAQKTTYYVLLYPYILRYRAYSAGVSSREVVRMPSQTSTGPPGGTGEAGPAAAKKRRLVIKRMHKSPKGRGSRSDAC